MRRHLVLISASRRGRHTTTFLVNAHSFLSIRLVLAVVIFHAKYIDAYNIGYGSMKGNRKESRATALIQKDSNAPWRVIMCDKANRRFTRQSAYCAIDN